MRIKKEETAVLFCTPEINKRKEKKKNEETGSQTCDSSGQLPPEQGMKMVCFTGDL